MRQSRTILAFTLAGAMLGAVSAWAQSDGNRTAEGQSPKTNPNQGIAAPGDAGLDLLRIEEVRSDLQIAEEQEQKLIAVGDESQDRPSDLRKKVLAILTPEQRQRLKQIRLQALGPAALTDPEVVKALDFTQKQRKMIMALPAQIRQATREALHGAQSLTTEQRSEKAADAREKVLKMALETLTPEQRAKFEKMKGARVDADFLDLWLQESALGKAAGGDKSK